ncbi:MAG: type II toxin-antitoxin system VapC family toxin [Sphingomonadales bacterium]|nr:MAG: type II toxin-antitoxin system VapC family toxin [Sphingomonadales bacterium]
MIVDTSAIMAIVLGEPEGEAMLIKLGEASVRRLSVGTWMELGAVIQRRYPSRAEIAEAFIRTGSFSLEAVTAEQGRIGREAYRIYGQGAGHPARLNFGDCFAYALAKTTGEPLLFKGDDFAQTDIAAA